MLTALPPRVVTLPLSIAMAFTVSPRLHATGVWITTTNLLPGTVGTYYSQTLTAVSVPPSTSYHWRISFPGTLPSGLNLNEWSGEISGTPDMATNVSFTVWVTDMTGLFETSKPLGMTIESAITITTSSPLPSGTVGNAYSQTLTASGGTLPYTWSVTSGGLPSGLSMSTNGVISGTPGMATNASFTVQVTDNYGLSSTKPLSLTTMSLAIAINQPTWVVTTSGSQPWSSQTTNTHDGVSAAQSGFITEYQQSWMHTTVTGPGTLTFWWKMSSGTGAEFLYFYRDDVFQRECYPYFTFWQNETIAIPAGSHTMNWLYTTGSSANTAGWVDEVSFIPSAPPRPTIIVNDGSFGFRTNGFGFNVSGAVDQIVAVEASTNLLVWRALVTNTMTGSPFYFKDTNTAPYPLRFYRLRSP